LFFLSILRTYKSIRLLKYIIYISILLLTLCNSTSLISQEVAISDELNVRNYFSYELIGQVDDRIIIYRDKGFTKEVDVYNEDMEHTQFSEFIFEKKKTDVYTVLGQDTAFQMIYGYLQKDSLVLRMREYDRIVRLIDSTTLIKIPKKDIKKRFQYKISQDKSKILLSSVTSDNQFIFIMYDCREKRISWTRKLVFEKDYYKRYEGMILTNDGKIIVHVPSDNSNTNELDFLIINPHSNQQLEFKVFLGENAYTDMYFEFDNINQNLIVCGNYSEKKGKEVVGLYLMKSNINRINATLVPTFIKHKSSLGQELLQGKKRNRKRIFDDLQVKKIVFRNDGGVLVISEITKEFSRRSPYNSTYARNNANSYARNGWVDHYTDDILITNINNDMQIDWTKVLYKKQFSQDDDAVFSSFFVMKTPSRLRFIYNDAIKKSSTVSEYLIDPTGKIARNSLLSTEYQNMKLRFQDALQLSANSILVPSEQNYDLNLVKITY